MVVAGRSTVAADVVALDLARADGGVLPAWSPGAHVDLLLAPGLERQYSLCSSPADRSSWRVAVLREPDGRGGSAYVHDKLDVGVTVRVRGPRNHFALQPSPAYLFVAGGIGVTPILPMVEAAHAAGADWRLVYGGRSAESMAFRDELARYGDRVELVPQEERGLIDVDDLLGTAAPDTLVYSCGPAGLLAAVEERCATWPTGSLHVERFSAVAPTEPDAPFDVVLERSGVTVHVPAGTSVLDAVRAAGIPVLASCEQGTCGTCETVVLGGTPQHRCTLLTAEERAAGDLMMICVSRAESPNLVLDL
ncbi:PDR/VanB family oxidoreductase [Kutzneria buriramensis]|nr:PDR/VanB family oxidoreductase [Kutzneria buriramensis]